jgi:uncharacterized damage-inducible protein DinB
MKPNDSLVQHLVDLLDGGSAHSTLAHAVLDFPISRAGARPAGAPHSAWQLLEHLRIAQHDILKFSQGPGWASPAWPEGYWPASAKPAGAEKWNASLRAFRNDLANFKKLLRARSEELYDALPWGDGQTLLREALLIADHNAYHIGQLVLVRRLLGAWPAE